MNKKYLKKAIDDDINKNNNYNEIMDRINKNKNVKIYKYALVPIILIIVIISFSLLPNNTRRNFRNDGIIEESVTISSKDEINVNNISPNKNTSSFTDDLLDYSKVDGIIKKIDSKKIIKEFKLEEMIIPKYYTNTSSYTLYTKDTNESKYNILHDYVLEYTNKDKIIKLSISKIEQPIKDYYFEEKEINYSIINNTKVIINNHDNNYNITFKLDNGYYDVEAENVSIDELIDIIKTIIK